MNPACSLRSRLQSTQCHCGGPTFAGLVVLRQDIGTTITIPSAPRHCAAGLSCSAMLAILPVIQPLNASRRTDKRWSPCCDLQNVTYRSCRIAPFHSFPSGSGRYRCQFNVGGSIESVGPFVARSRSVSLVLGPLFCILAVDDVSDAGLEDWLYQSRAVRDNIQP